MSVALPDLSVVIPIRNEAGNLDALCREFRDVLDGWRRPYELLLIDDGSTDGSWEILRRLQDGDPHIRLIKFRRNFGQTAAFAAGIAQARGRLIVTSDGDLQNDPRDIPRLVAHLERDDLDIVCGWRKDRKDPFLTRRLPSQMANRLISWATGVRLHDYGCSLKVFRAEVIKPLRLYGEMHRFLPALASEQGVQIAEEAVNHRPRIHGRSNYGLSRTVRVVLDLLTVKFLLNYSTRPLQVFGLVGFILGGAGILTLGYLGAIRLLGYASLVTEHLPLLLFGILLAFAGMQLVTLGLLAEIQVRAYHESANKATYAIREIREPREPGA